MKVKDISKNFKYINPIYWIKRRKTKKIYNILIDARHIYSEHIANKIYLGMCICIIKAYVNKNIYIHIKDIKKHIPEFNRIFCNADNMTDSYWWELYDVEPRIKAFNKLIKCYINKMN